MCRLPGAVVQLVRIPACHAGGRGFESRPLRHFFKLMKPAIWLLAYSQLRKHAHLPHYLAHYYFGLTALVAHRCLSRTLSVFDLRLCLARRGGCCALPHAWGASSACEEQLLAALAHRGADGRIGCKVAIAPVVASYSLALFPTPSFIKNHIAAS